MKQDVHGRDSLVKNILTNWMAQFVQIAAGFVIPRLIDRGLSQQALGVWDLAWSIIVYLNIVQVGVTSSINRYVAYHRATEDYDGINRVVSSIVMVMRGMAVVVVGLTLFLAWEVGNLFSDRLQGFTYEAKWLVLLLGIGVAVQVSSAVFASILTGLHRWDWHNGIQAGTNVAMLVGMVLSLKLGFGLIGLAVVHLVTEALGRTARVLVAYKLCPWLKVRIALFDWKTAREMVGFGGKTFASNVSQLVLNSSVSLLIAGALGPAALALYSRPMSLIRNLTLLVNKYAMVFSPTISSLQGAGKHQEVKHIALQATRYGLYILLPPAAFLIVFSSEVMHLWMGAAYVQPWLMTVLLAGSTMQIASVPMFKAMVGLNLHGRVAAANITGAVVAFTGAYLAIHFFQAGLVAVALAVAVPMTISNGIFVQLYGCRHLEVGMAEYIRLWTGPVTCVAAFVLILAGAKFFIGGLMGLLAGAVAGSAVLVALYWYAVVPTHYKKKLTFARSQAAAQRAG